jgi:hypothetical protein
VAAMSVTFLSLARHLPSICAEMTWGRIFFITSVSIAGIGAGPVRASDQALYDKVGVDLPYPVSVNGTVLQPGHYVFRQIDDAGSGSRALMILSDQGTKLKPDSFTITTPGGKTPEHTSVQLQRYGDQYYFNKLWIGGRNYGYEFPLPAAVKDRGPESMQAFTVPAKYEPTAQNEEAPLPTPVSRPAPSTPPMPQTASNWLNLVASGLMLAVAGMMLRKIRV